MRRGPVKRKVKRNDTRRVSLDFRSHSVSSTVRRSNDCKRVEGRKRSRRVRVVGETYTKSSSYPKRITRVSLFPRSALEASSSRLDLGRCFVGGGGGWEVEERNLTMEAPGDGFAGG